MSPRRQNGFRRKDTMSSPSSRRRNNQIYKDANRTGRDLFVTAAGSVPPMAGGGMGHSGKRTVRSRRLQYPARSKRTKRALEALMTRELFGCNFSSSASLRYLLKPDSRSVVSRAVIGLRVNTERRETTIVGGAKPLLVDIFGR